MSMDIYELVEVGLAATDRSRIDIVDLQPVEVTTEGEAGLTAIVSQLAYNATQLLFDEEDKVRIRGVIEPDGYSLLISDNGSGMSDQFLEGLNQILANSRDLGDGVPTSGVQMVAGLAARHGIGVRLEHGDPGVTARVTIPSRLLEERARDIDDVIDRPPTELVTARSRPLAIDTETFLESVFGPLKDVAVATKAETKVATIGADAASPVAPIGPGPLPEYRRATLRTRIPGRNYNESDPTPSHTKPGEAAVEIKLALADFSRGREAASGSVDDPS
jgi:hypothetical protein